MMLQSLDAKSDRRQESTEKQKFKARHQDYYRSFENTQKLIKIRLKTKNGTLKYKNIKETTENSLILLEDKSLL